MSEEEIKKLQEEKEKALAEKLALEEQLKSEHEKTKELQTKYDTLQKDADNLRLNYGKLLLQKTNDDEDEDNKGKEEPEKSFDEQILDILNMKE